MLEFEELLPSSIRRRLRTGHKVVYPEQEPKHSFCGQGKKHEYESYETLKQVFDRKNNQTENQAVS